MARFNLAVSMGAFSTFENAEPHALDRTMEDERDVAHLERIGISGAQLESWRGATLEVVRVGIPSSEARSPRSFAVTFRRDRDPTS